MGTSNLQTPGHRAMNGWLSMPLHRWAIFQSRKERIVAPVDASESQHRTRYLPLAGCEAFDWQRCEESSGGLIPPLPGIALKFLLHSSNNVQFGSEELI